MSDDISDRLTAMERLLGIHAEETRTRLEAAADKHDRAIAALSEIASQLSELARNDERQWHAIAALERRVDALETPVTKRRKPAGKK
jgi:hypothetical protein